MRRVLGHLLVLLTIGACSNPPATPSSDTGREDVERHDMGGHADMTTSDCDETFTRPVTLQDARGEARVEVEVDDACRRTYRLHSTASRRDGQPASPRAVAEAADWPRMRSGNALFDGLYALALEELRQNSVDAISDAAFRDGQPIDCPDGGCFETGALWHYVWTRDISYAVDLGIAGLDPVRALNSLRFKVSERRGGGDPQVMQDTGTGGSYPVSTDRVVWALGARAVVAQLPEDQQAAFVGEALDALLNTVRHDRLIAFDESTGLYFGEQSFLDWREQSYPSWVEGDPTPIASSRALSTNLLHLRALEITGELAAIAGRSAEVAELDAWATGLREAIRDRLWVEDAGLFATYLVTHLDTAPPRQFDLLGSALAILFDVADAAQAERIVASYPHLGVGAPVIFPQQQFTPIYHNRAEWPFVSAYWLRAAARAGNDSAATRMFETLIRGAALNLSNMENWEIATGEPWVEDGEYSGPVVNSQRQLWSVAGFVSMAHHTLFGLRPDLQDGSRVLHVSPALPRAVRAEHFAASERLELHDVRYLDGTFSIALLLPEDTGTTGFYQVDSITLNGEPVSSPIPADALGDGATLVVELTVPTSPTAAAITLADDTDWREVFAPRPPTITSINGAGAGATLLFFTTPDELSSLTWAVYRDGEQIATGLDGSTVSWLDEAVDDWTTFSPCYVVETCFRSSGACSQHSEPQCWWGIDSERVISYPAESFSNSGGVLSEEHGRTHWSQWGDPGHRLTLTGVIPATDGPQLLQLAFGNGAGSVTSGITAAVKRVVVTDEIDETIVADGYVVMPHLGDWSQWGLSTFVEVPMDTTRSYRVEIISDADRAVNMSSFTHFASYGGSGGDAPFNRVNIAELRLLSR